MNIEGIEKLGDLIKAYWYDRDEDDIEIVCEVVNETTDDHLSNCLRLAEEFHQLLSSSESHRELLRKWVWHPLPKKDEELQLWLEEILDAFSEASSGASVDSLRAYANKKGLSIIFSRK